MNFSTNYTVRTDIADENVQIFLEKKGQIDDGILFSDEQIHGITVHTVQVENEKGVQISQKPMGKYVTVSLENVTLMSKEQMENSSIAVGEVIKRMIPQDGLCLVACLGNKDISSDAVGPMTSKNIVVTRHIKMHNESLFEKMNFRECACIVPGVMGDTGAEAFEIIKGVCNNLKPSFVIAVDALASRHLSRLGKTVQISDSGINPGSGVHNNRSEISKKTLGVPVISVGVPTVVDAMTVTAGILKAALGEDKHLLNAVENKLRENPADFFVTPKETDRIVKNVSKLVGQAINYALQKSMSFSEMDELLS